MLETHLEGTHKVVGDVRMRVNDVAKEGEECPVTRNRQTKEQNLPAPKSPWEECGSADTFILDFSSPELWGKKKRFLDILSH